MGGKLNVYNLGALGVNLVSGHIHMKDGELLQCQNAMPSPEGAQVALKKRPGMAFVSAPGGHIWGLKSFLQKAYREHDTTLGTAWRSVRYASSLAKFCAVNTGATNNVITSSDALTWAVGSGTLGCVAVEWAPSLGLFAAVRSGSVGGTAKVMTSPDGITWTTRNFATSNADWQGIAWSPALSLFVAVSETGVSPTPLNTSPDGITWTSRTGVSGGWRKVIWAPTPAIFLKMGHKNAGDIARFGTSPDGINWTLRATTIDTIFNDAIYVDSLSLFVAVGNLAAGGKYVATSPDGITWTGHNGPGKDLWCIDYASELGLLVAGGSTAYFFSANGVDWWEAAGTELSFTRGSDLVWVSSLERFGCSGGNGVGAFSFPE